MHEKSIVRPAVSVIIPAFRASRDIPVALDSVFAQTFADFEVIVVDDGSPDSAELKAAIAPYRSRLQFIQQANRGAGAARNAGIRAARGRFIAFLDADDRWAPEFLARQVYFLEANRTCALVYLRCAGQRRDPARREAIHGDRAVEWGGHPGQVDSTGMQHHPV